MLSELRVKATEAKQMINSFVQAAERDTIQRAVEERMKRNPRGTDRLAVDVKDPSRLTPTEIEEA